MGDDEIQTDDFFTGIETLFQNIPDDVALLFDDHLPMDTNPSGGDSIHENSNPSPDGSLSWIDELEELLMKDDTDSCVENPEEFCQDFFSDVLDASPEQTCEPRVSDASPEQTCEPRVSDEDTSTPEANVSDDNPENEKFEDSVPKEGQVDDRVSKKRKRQLRNKDAALRSRERKKVYVKDLELKSKYLEGECRRLGRLLQCYIAENQALHISLQNKVSGAVTKQESAVLLLESLLLGSLLWFLGIMCLFSLPALPYLNLGDPVPEDEGRKDQIQERATQMTPRNEKLDLRFSQLFHNSRRCKATRTKMKTYPVIHVC